VGHQPHFIGRVPGKAAAHMVEQAASVHALQRLLRHGPGLGLPCAPGVPEQEDQIMRRGEFWRVPEAAPAGVKTPGVKARRHACQCPVWKAGACALRFPEPVGQRLSGGQQTAPIFPPQARRLLQQGQQRLSGEVRPRPEGLLLRREQHRQRPSAGACHSHAGGHIDRVHIRALLPVDFDRDKIPVDRLRHRLVLKGLMGHDVAPVAGGVADAEEHRLVLLPCGLECLAPPGPPVHGIFPVLEQIRGLFKLQPVGHGSSSFDRAAHCRPHGSAGFPSSAALAPCLYKAFSPSGTGRGPQFVPRTSASAGQIRRERPGKARPWCRTGQVDSGK